MRAAQPILVAVALLAASCGGADGDGLFATVPTAAAADPVSSASSLPSSTVTTATPPSASAATTSIPGTSPTSVASVTTDPATAPGAELMIETVLLRYGGPARTGVLQVLVCNVGEADAGAFDVEINAGSAERVLIGPGVAARSCTAVFDPAATLESMGIPDGGTVAVRARVSADTPAGITGDGFSEEVSVAGWDLEPPAADQEAYDECRARPESHSECARHLGPAPHGDPVEVTVVGGDLVAVAPAAFEELATMAVVTMARCFSRIESYVEFPLDERFRPVVWRMGLGPAFFGADAGSIVLWTSETYLTDAAAGLYENWSWETYLDGACMEAHEHAHVMVAHTPLPNWLDEGLAVYLSNAQRTGWWAEDGYRCEEDGWFDIHPVTGAETFEPYATLDGGWPDEGRDPGDYYITGACFWTWFERAFGHGAFTDVMQMLYSERSLENAWPGCPGFLERIEPIIGEDISGFTTETFGFGHNYLDYPCWGGS